MSTAIPVFPMKTGDLLPTLRQQLADDSGPLDLSQVATVGLRLRLKGAAASLSLAGAGSVYDAPNGLVEFAWAGADTATPGIYEAEWVLTYNPGAKPRTVPASGRVLVVIEQSL